MSEDQCNKLFLQVFDGDLEVVTEELIDKKNMELADPIMPNCGCYCCKNSTRNYICHL